MARFLVTSCLLLSLAACSGSDPDAAGTGDGTDTGGVNGGLPPGNGGTGGLPAGASVVYAHTATELFRIDPTTLAETRIGAFGAIDAMTDIAVDGSGALYGVTYGSVVRIDAATAAATELSQLGGLDAYVGLSFLSSDSGGAELLVGTTQEGIIYSIDPATGATSRLGAFGGGYGCSGDVVSVRGLGTIATAVGVGAPGGGGGDVLVRIDAATGQATAIGAVGFDGVWGLGFWEDRLYGFTAGGDFITIDPTSGVGTSVRTGASSWSGAGVTTTAPVDID